MSLRRLLSTEQLALQNGELRDDWTDLIRGELVREMAEAAGLTGGQAERAAELVSRPQRLPQDQQPIHFDPLP